MEFPTRKEDEVKRHVLKTWPVPFKALYDGRKTFEIRKFDRDFQEGDQVSLQEWVPGKIDDNKPPEGYTGRWICATITYIVSPGLWGMPEDVGAFGIQVWAKGDDFA